MATKNENVAAAAEGNPNYVELLAQTGQAALKNLKDTQDAFFQAAHTAGAILPKVPELKSPVDPKLPSARQLLEVNFDLANKFLVNQKEYAERFLALLGA